MERDAKEIFSGWLIGKGEERRGQDARTSRAPVGLSVGRSMVRV